MRYSRGIAVTKGYIAGKDQSKIKAGSPESKKYLRYFVVYLDEKWKMNKLAFKFGVKTWLGLNCLVFLALLKSCLFELLGKSVLSDNAQ